MPQEQTNKYTEGLTTAPLAINAFSGLSNNTMLVPLKPGFLSVKVRGESKSISRAVMTKQSIRARYP